MQTKTHGFKVVFHHENVSDLVNVFNEVIVFPLNLVVRVSFTFLASKVT